MKLHDVSYVSTADTQLEKTDSAATEADEVVIIAEVRLHEVEQVIALVKEFNVAVEEDTLMHCKSLVAKKGLEVLAVAACIRAEEGEPTVHVLIKPDTPDEQALATRLIDKACKKMRSHQVNSFRILLPPNADEGLWTQVGFIRPAA